MTRTNDPIYIRNAQIRVLLKKILKTFFGPRKKRKDTTALILATRK
jgi:hypothetical protein